MYIDPASIAVCLLEPSQAQARLIAGMLAKRGFARVTVVESAAALLETCRQDMPGLVVSTFYPPDMDAAALVTRLRGQASTAAIPFILISSETRHELLEPIRQGGACAILPKPFTDSQLEQALRTTLEDPNEDAPLDLPGVEIENLRVLLVDDSGSARGFSRRILGNLGLRTIIEAASGDEALRLLQETAFDLVVTDFNMPGMDGRQLTAAIRRESWQASVPIVMITSDDNPARLEAALQAGVSALCPKPLEPARLRAVLASVLQTGA